MAFIDILIAAWEGLSDKIPNQKCKLVTFQIDTCKVIGRSTLLTPYAVPVLVMDYSTRHRSPYAVPVLIMDYLTRHCCIQSAILSRRKMNRRWYEISIRSLQCRKFSSESWTSLMADEMQQMFWVKASILMTDADVLKSCKANWNWHYHVTCLWSIVAHICFRSGADVLSCHVMVKNVSIILLKIYPHPSYTNRFRIEIQLEVCNRISKTIKTAISAIKRQ